MASCSRAFRKPKNPEEERKLIENGTPKATFPLKKYSLKKISGMAEWYVNKNPVLEPRVLSQLATGYKTWTLL